MVRKKLEYFNEARISNANFLSKNLQGVVLPEVTAGYHHVFHQYTIRVPDGKRDALVEHLTENQIGSGIYYPVPIHQQTYYTEALGYDQSLPEAERASVEVLSLPVHPGLDETDLDKIVTTVNEFMQ